MLAEFVPVDFPNVQDNKNCAIITFDAQLFLSKHVLQTASKPPIYLVLASNFDIINMVRSNEIEITQYI